MNNNYAKAYKEVYEVLKFLSEDYIQKIPKEKLDMIEEKMDRNHKFKYDTDIEFEEQNLLIETKAILANIFRDYLATVEQRQKIKEYQANERKNEDTKKREKYNPDDLFKNKKQNLSENIGCTQLVKVKKETLLQKIINKIKNILHIDK